MQSKFCVPCGACGSVAFTEDACCGKGPGRGSASASIASLGKRILESPEQGVCPKKENLGGMWLGLFTCAGQHDMGP